MVVSIKDFVNVYHLSCRALQVQMAPLVKQGKMAVM